MTDDLVEQLRLEKREITWRAADEISCLRAELAAERERADKAEADNAANFEAAQREFGERLVAEASATKLRGALERARPELQWISRHGFEETKWRADAALEAIDAVLKETANG